MRKNLTAWFCRRKYVDVDFLSGILWVLFALKFRAGYRGVIAVVWRIYGNSLSYQIIWTVSANYTLGDCLVGLRVEVGTGTLVVPTGVNMMGTRLSFGFYTLKYDSRVNLIIILTSCSKSCPCLLPMVYIKPSGCRYCR